MVTALLFGVAITGVLVYAAVGNPLDPFDDRRFSPAAWQMARTETRARMAHDVVTRAIRRGMPEQQVVTLLGSPERVSGKRGPGGEPLGDRRIYEYSIGSWTFQRMDDAFVYVHIDSSDHVATAEIYGY